ncbi:hypothetical protein [Vibrio barjaei]|uniref:hypothetical protein n=1 Tax=Vibrio barjaei TaxID=1676683 RepID=UPI00228417C2|nr:hypothetical protein [Vibrio barjaei]MCY9874614.1 hypothetical protein [Vibrio barjaei]
MDYSLYIEAIIVGCLSTCLFLYAILKRRSYKQAVKEIVELNSIISGQREVISDLTVLFQQQGKVIREIQYEHSIESGIAAGYEPHEFTTPCCEEKQHLIKELTLFSKQSIVTCVHCDTALRVNSTGNTLEFTPLLLKESNLP